jgi:hypothetical protein
MGTPLPRCRYHSNSHGVNQLTGIDPTEDPPIKPGQPIEPPQEDPPGSPRPEIPPPLQDPGESNPPRELPGSMPDELPVRGPPGPQTPATDIARTRMA